jgi:hypothetical protein
VTGDREAIMMTQIIPRSPISIRAAVASDVPFIDRLQKMHSKMVGWMPTKQIEGKIAAGNVLIAMERGMGLQPMQGEDTGCKPVPLGYVISQDQYFKRDDLGIVYQLNVVPGHQRGLIGATLIKTVFERAAYGCRLFCCWCAQDIEANRFWESLGFIPLAFRSGSRSKSRTHIFWQRRIREGDVSTPYWFPSQTSAGSIREDRLVLPIPPGTSWKDVMPVVLPGQERGLGILPEPIKAAPRKRSGKMPKPRMEETTATRGLRFGPLPQAVVEKPKREKQQPRAKLKNDPRHVAAARELRDRYLEQFNSGLLPGESSQGKYAVERCLGDSPTHVVVPAPKSLTLAA